MLLDLLWPAECAGCGRVGAGRLCDGCLPAGMHRFSAPTAFVEGTWVMAGYDSGIGRAVAKAKARSDLLLLRRLGAAFAERLAPCLVDAPFVALVPAPSHPSTMVRRAFSGAAVLAEAVSYRTGIPSWHVLRRRGGHRQASLDAHARRLNLRGQVRCEHPLDGAVLLVDDVITTGATIEASAIELLGSGARSVWVGALCAVRCGPRLAASPRLDPEPLPSSL